MSLVALYCFISLAGSVVDGDQGSTKGSIIFGPDGSVIKVGESVKLSARASQASAQDVHDVIQPGMIGNSYRTVSRVLSLYLIDLQVVSLFQGI